MNFKTFEEVYQDVPVPVLEKDESLLEYHDRVVKWPDIKCLHLTCSQCKGTGIKKDGTPCIHYISCPCKNCNIKM